MKIQNSHFSEPLGATKFNAQSSSVVLLLAVCCLLSAFGCGYTVRGKASLPFSAVRIVKIENKTLEPKLQDRLYTALTEEFLKQGVDVNPSARYELRGTIKQFTLGILSEKSDIATEYEVTIKGDFKLTDPSGGVKEFKDIGSPFIITFSGSGRLNDLIASKELASDQAIRDMAEEIVAALVYR